ncbi:hypothetical protein E2C01_072665 [Portunus trituberculatus]|uniref:Uncharacterized protein n=1 Tax=Portunus trituberculatus TaxID=210409 RepID=A0A5B7I7B0_PORTR|nr:hypothetical protein [Portunus trituberculatus]
MTELLPKHLCRDLGLRITWQAVLTVAKRTAAIPCTCETPARAELSHTTLECIRGHLRLGHQEALARYNDALLALVLAV